MLLEQGLPSLAYQCGVFEAAAFQTVYSGTVVQQIAADYSAYAEKLSVRADSILARLDDNDFNDGIQALRSKAAMTTNTVVVEPIDFVVFKKGA